MPPIAPVAVPAAPAALSTPFAPTAEYRPFRGLYLDAHLGLGQLQVTFADHTISGSAYPLGLAGGIAAASNLILFGELYEAHVFRPIGNRDNLSSLNLYGLGPGLKYYFKSTNVFLSGTLLLSRLGYTDTESSHWGVTGRFSIGKEWWVSPSWSLGLTGDVLLGRMEGKTFGYPDESYTYTTKGFSLLFSSSFSYPSGMSLSADKPGAPSGDGPHAGTPSDSSAGYHTHDGFYVSARLGLGWLWVSTDGGGSISGSGYPLALSAGFALTERLVLIGEFYRASLLDPKTNGYGLANLDLQGFGPGLKYYFMPSNIFLSSSLLISEISYHNGIPGDTRYGTSETSPWGIAGRFGSGKEWWISAEWGLGISAEGLFGHMGDYTVKGFALLGSASFN